MKAVCGKRGRRIKRLLRQGDVLARLLGAAGASATWSLVRAAMELEPECARQLMARPFLGGRLRPTGDHLPGIEGAGSQTWTWHALPPRPRPTAIPAVALAAAEHVHG